VTARPPSPLFVPAGTGPSAAITTLWGSSPFATKLSGDDCDGRLFVAEVADVTGFGPPRHVHHGQDEWFHVTKGSFAIEVGGELYEATAGDSLFAPREVVHTWAPLGGQPATLLFALQPAGDFDRFVRDAAELGRLPTPEEANAIFSVHGMEIVGPPLDVVTTGFTG
jgi:quercetin dioxygenase-like cupin family protein